MLDDGWMIRAKCREVDDPDTIFFPNTKRGVRTDARAAKKICHDCPVRQHCLVYSVVHREPRGVWGGLTETERRSIPREIKRRMREAWKELHPAIPQRRVTA